MDTILALTLAMERLRPGAEFKIGGEGTLDSVEMLGSETKPTQAEVDAEIATITSENDDNVAVRSEIIDQYQAATARLTAIVTDGPAYTQAQLRDALIDMARIQNRLLKYIKSTLQ